jgi:Zn-dependent metalloprotease
MAALLAALIAAPSAGARTGAVDAALKRADAPAAQLRPTARATLPGGAIVERFGQEVGGVPVVGAGVVVVDQIAAKPELLFDKTRDEIAAPATPAVSRSAAIVTATAGEDSSNVSVRQVIVPGRAGTLAWEVTYSTPAPADYVVDVNAVTGDVISKRNLIRDVTGHARVFVPNAVVENDGYRHADGGTFNIKDDGDADSAALTALRSPVTLENIDDGQDCLRGAWVNARYGQTQKELCKASLDWSHITRHSNKFEALMAYYHVDQAQQYIQSLGFGTINAESQDVVVDSVSEDNSYYHPNIDQIEMGSGGVDDAEDADVFVHEYGHAIQDAQTSGTGFGGGNRSDSGAQGEGFGDYFAEAYSTEKVGFDDEWSHCVMEWDATSYDNNTLYPPGICLRRTDDPRTLSQQSTQVCGTQRHPDFEIHCIGEVWSSALFELRQQLGDSGGDSVMDKVVLASHTMLPDATPSFKEGSEALLAADDSLYPDASNQSGMGDGLHCDEIRAEMVSRELLGGGFSCT